MKKFTDNFLRSLFCNRSKIFQAEWSVFHIGMMMVKVSTIFLRTFPVKMRNAPHLSIQSGGEFLQW